MLLTGGTGFLGGRLLPRLVEAGYQVTCLLRAKDERSAAARLRESLERRLNDRGVVESTLSNLTVLAGDIVRDKLGLKESAYRALRKGTDQILHCAASTGFSPEIEDEQWACNVEGTRHLADLAVQTEPPVSFHHVSTAYVAGARKGVVYEDELDEGQAFHNEYEKSKCVAEKMLHEYKNAKGLKLTVYRPSIIIGEPGPAGTGLFSGLGLFIKFLRAAKQSFGKTDRQGRVITPVRVIGNPDITKNLVPVECVVRMIEAVFTRPQAHGRTYHITHENPPTLGLIWDVTLDLLGIVGAKLVGEESFALRPASVPERFFRQQMELYAPYLRHEPAFDKSNAGSTRWPRSGRSSSKATRSKNGPFRGKTALRGFYRGFYRTFASPSSRFLRVGSRFPTTILHNSPLDTPRS